jgi:hypothetical protein
MDRSHAIDSHYLNLAGSSTRARDEVGFHTERAQFGGERLARFVAAAGDDNLGAFVSEGQGAVARPMPVRAPVIMTTRVLI